MQPCNLAVQEATRKAPIASFDAASQSPSATVEPRTPDIDVESRAGPHFGYELATNSGYPKACQMRTIAFCVSPVSAAISRVLQ
jgi:hypothetical protein